MSQKSISRRKRDLTEKLLDLSHTDLFKSMVQDDLLEDLPDSVRSRFIELQSQVADKLYRSGRLLASLQLETLFLQIFKPESSGGWALEHVHNPSPEIGIENAEVLLDVMTKLAGEEGEDRIAFFSFGSPAQGPDEPYFMVFILGDAQGHCAAGFMLDSATHWVDLDSPPLVGLLRTILPYQSCLPENFYQHFAEDVVTAVVRWTEDESFRASPAADGILEVIPEHLAYCLAPVLDESAVLRLGLGIRVRDAFEAFSLKIAERFETQLSAMEKAHEKQLKRIKRDQDKSAMLLKGCQERAARLSQEVEKLRKEKGVTPPATSSTAPSLGEALDALFR